MHDLNTGYQLALSLPLSARNSVRGITRLLNKEKRNFYWQNLESLHINLQHLGDNLSSDNLQIIKDYLLQSIPYVKAPEVSCENITFGNKGELSPTKMFFPVLKNSYLLNLSKAIHNSIKDLDLEGVRKVKDYADQIYKLHIAASKRALGKAHCDKINKFLRENTSAFSFKSPSLLILEQRYVGKSNVYKRLAEIEFAQ